MKSKIVLSALTLALLGAGAAHSNVSCPDFSKGWQGEEQIGDWKLLTGAQWATEQREKKDHRELTAYHAWYILKHKEPGHPPMDCVYKTVKEGEKPHTVSYVYTQSEANLHFNEHSPEVKCSVRETIGWKCSAPEGARTFPSACDYIAGQAAPCPPHPSK